ncbi:MAG: LysM peptidoglycan-binding domain-containing protein [Bacteroidia bacterium]|nr:LysM peptidoglycan-binding domain-containing protein [Bacteroidia bacterium]
MKHFLATLGIGLILLAGTPAKAQYGPDTSLSYTTFLKQCQQFTQNRQDEIWVVNFWASWNGPSLTLLSGMSRLYGQYTQKPIRFVSICVDKNKGVWAQQVFRSNLPWEHLFLPKESEYAFLKQAFKHNSLPGLFIVMPDGQIQRLQDELDLGNELEYLAATLPDKAYYSSTASTRTQFSADSDTRPSTTPAAGTDAPDVSQGWITHTVKSGDTLYSLYRKYNIPVQEIKRQNALASDAIKVGQVLKIKRI